MLAGMLFKPSFDDSRRSKILGELQSVNYRASSAFFFLIWEWLITLDDEVEYIWSRPWHSWFKWVFLLARYLPILFEFGTRAFSQAICLGIKFNGMFLDIWYGSQVFVAAFAVCLLDIVLMVRVYAIYRRPRWMLVFFFLLLFGELLIAAVATVLSILKKQFQPWLLIFRMPRSFAYFCASAFAVQIIIILLTVVKCIRGRRTQIPVIKMVIRDGSFACIVLTMASVLMMVYTLLDLSYSVGCYAWLLTSVSCAICRTNIMLQKTLSASARTPDGQRAPFTDAQLTQFFLSDSRSVAATEDVDRDIDPQ